MTQNSRKVTLRQRLFARFMANADELSHELYGGKKRALLGSLHGRVLEIGPGTGVNLRYLNPDIRWLGIEPNKAMHGNLLAEAKRLGLKVELKTSLSEDQGLAKGSFDTVISTLVLCSVRNPDETLREICSLLKPGGKFVFLEHVADRPWSLRWIIQKIVPFTPWRYFSDGCNPGRDITKSIRQAGFQEADCRSYHQAGAGIILAINRPHIWGKATKAL